MTSTEFNVALPEAGFGVDRGWIVDVSDKCPFRGDIPVDRDASALT
jgi:hypothetical protein